MIMYIVSGLLSISLIICWIVIIQMQKENKELKRKIEDHDELIKDLYRINDERILHS